MLKNIFVFIIFLVSFENLFSQQDSQILKKYDRISGYYYYKVNNKIVEFPKLIINKSKVEEILKNELKYPRFAKDNFIDYRSFINIKVDITGKISSSAIFKKGNTKCFNIDMFDTIALNIINKLNGKYTAGGIDTLTYPIPVNFYYSINFDKRKAFFKISFLDNFFIIDSTDTYPAQMLSSDTSRLTEKGTRGSLPEYSKFVGSFGTTRLGFDVDTLGKVQDVRIAINSYPSIDKQALIDFNNIKNIWKPAAENGVPINSYMEYDMVYGYPNDELNKGKKYFSEGKFDLALEQFNILRKYYIDDIDLIFNIAMTEIQLDKFADACKDLEEIKRISISVPYHSCVSEEKVDEFIKKMCSQ